MELSTNQYPTRLVFLTDRQHLKAATYPAFLGHFSRGVLNTEHMAEAAPFPCPRH